MKSQERYFLYDTKRYKKKLLYRFAIVGVLFSIFVVWNFLQIPSSDRKEFLALFLPMSILLGIFLTRSFNRQIRMLGDIALAVDGKTLKQYDKNVEANEYDLTSVEKICLDEYKTYPRVVLEWEETAMSFVNLENSDEFVSAIESATGLKREVFPKQNEILSIRALYYLIPSIVYAVLIGVLGTGSYPYMNWKIFLLFLNMNLIIYVLYGTSSDEVKYNSVYQTRRKILFVLLVLFVYQVVAQFSSSLGLI